MNEVESFVSKVISENGLCDILHQMMNLMNFRIAGLDFVRSIFPDLGEGMGLSYTCEQQYLIRVGNWIRERREYEAALNNFFGSTLDAEGNATDDSNGEYKIICSDNVCDPFYIVFDDGIISDVKFFNVKSLSSCEYRYFAENVELVYNGLLFKAHRSARYVSSRRKTVVVLFSSVCSIYRNSFPVTNGAAGVAFDRDAAPTSQGLKMSIIGVYGIENIVRIPSKSKKYLLYSNVENILPECKKDIVDDNAYWEGKLKETCHRLIDQYDNPNEYIENAWMEYFKSGKIKNMWIKYNRFRVNKLGLGRVDVKYLSPDINECQLFS